MPKIIDTAFFFGGDLDPPQPMIMAFIDDMRGAGHAVEPICRVLREQGARSPRGPTEPGKKPTGPISVRVLSDTPGVLKPAEIPGTVAAP